jgi:Zn-dependent peptidase ImmA (M78 family)
MAFIGTRPRTGSEAAIDLLDQLWDGSLPIRPEQIAHQMRVALVGRGGSVDFNYPYSGFFTYQNGHPTIEYNVTDPLVRRRFTVAHELGHYILGHQHAPRDTSDFSRSRSPIEVQANQFAAELLMPAQVVRTMALSGRATVDQLAETFAVSRQAMEYRLANLSLSL